MIYQRVANGGSPDPANGTTQNPANETTPVLQMKSHKIGLQMKSRRILGLANEIAQNPANAISQRVANGGSPDLANEITQDRAANEITPDLGSCK